MKVSILIAVSLMSMAAQASSMDKEVGQCVGYMVATNRNAGAVDAMKLADSPRTAMAHAKVFMQRWKTFGPSLSGGDACRTIGIYPSSYRMTVK